MNAVVQNVNLSNIEELNTIYACVLLKGSGKDKENSRSYRTISTCPLLAKALDCYVRDLSLVEWQDQQAQTQYQGPGMSHELASLLLTETLQYSVNVAKKPVYALFLDAKSAFDRTTKEILIRNLYIAGTDDHRLLYLNNRLGNRNTFCEFDKIMMGPIHDIRGLEQGGISSSDQYKIYNNEQANVAHSSELGVPIFNLTISCISLADDTVLLSNHLYNLENLLFLSDRYCLKYDVVLVPEKTNLVAFQKNNCDDAIYERATSRIALHSRELPFSQQAIHLGVTRSEDMNNMAHVLDRLSSHRKQLFSLLPAGLALNHSGNPAAALRVEKVYCLPTLLSGLASLSLTKPEVRTITNYYKQVLGGLMKTFDCTPDCAIYFLAGLLPAEGYLHLRQLSLFGMVSRLENNVLKDIAIKILSSALPLMKSVFQHVRQLCLLYKLPDALTQLKNPLPKAKFKTICRLQVYEYWHAKLSFEATNLPSLRYLDPRYLSLSSPHPLWTSLNGNPYEAKAARIQALFLTGRYRTEKLSRYWSSNRNGFCLQHSCSSLGIIEDRTHILLHCQALNETRSRLSLFTTRLLQDLPLLGPIIDAYLYSDDDAVRMQFLLDCSVQPMVIAAKQLFGSIVLERLFKLTRTWCFSLHKSRLKLLGRAPF